MREHRLEPARQPAASERAKTGWAELRTESSAVPSGGAAVHLDPKTLEAIIAGLSAQLRGSGALGETFSSRSGGPSAERERRPRKQPEDR